MPTSLRSALRRYAAPLSLIGITMIWGGTFLAIQYTLSASSPLFFVGCRFAAATLAVGLLSWRALPGMCWADLRAGLWIGLALAVGYGAQTIGLQTITSSESALLTALYMPLVLLLQWLLTRRMPSWRVGAGVLLAFIGLVLLTGNATGPFSLNAGQSLTLACAAAVAIEIVLISRYAGRVDLRRVVVVQLAVAALLAFALMPLAGEHSVPPFSWTLLIGAGGLGLASALIQWVMNWAQREVDATHAAIIYAGEPVWAGLIGRLAGERLPGPALLGGALVIAGIVLSQLRARRRHDKTGAQAPSGVE